MSLSRAEHTEIRRAVAELNPWTGEVFDSEPAKDGIVVTTDPVGVRESDLPANAIRMPLRDLLALLGLELEP